jgi:1-acyl-sn-glycerol-3-phosphate acyltransferase
MLALEAGLPIVPLAVRGSAAVLPARSLRIGSGDIEVVVGAPIAVAGRERDALIAEVRSFMREHLGEPDGAGRDVPLAAEAR